MRYLVIVLIVSMIVTKYVGAELAQSHSMILWASTIFGVTKMSSMINNLFV
jgi:hypothetical protein